LDRSSSSRTVAQGELLSDCSRGDGEEEKHEKAEEAEAGGSGRRLFGKRVDHGVTGGSDGLKIFLCETSTLQAKKLDAKDLLRNWFVDLTGELLHGILKAVNPSKDPFFDVFLRRRGFAGVF